ncbi:hypothetical protein BD311DRAFT_663467 [Dichomitus squalens]|uniref:BTB domain-containing protein n=1 Tax=Dichomitus squalens TaxID=114155 RepID=A0A4Q9MLD9_9APHY|nr:hypothetical protein BD311DRAFT_663467 [Dichomitus squalens]
MELEESVPPVEKREPEESQRLSLSNLDPATGRACDLPTLVKDHEFWFDDGTVLIVSRGVEFRVYKGLLADHSVVFKELFSQPHSHHTLSISDEQTIRCPLVHVTESPQELRHLLRVYMPRKGRSFWDVPGPTYEEISASIRMGHKYDLKELYEQSLAFLKRHYTTDLRVWAESDYYTPPGWKEIYSIGVVNLARLVGETSILPTALLACTVMNAEIVRGFTYEDGSQETLSPDDLGLCFQAKSRVRQASIGAVVRTFRRSVAPGCKQAAVCKSALRTALHGLEAFIDKLVLDDPFFPFEEFVKDRKLGVCEFCMRLVRQRNWNERVAVWNSLPGLFGLDVPGWGNPLGQPPPGTQVPAPPPPQPPQHPPPPPVCFTSW